jgi:hypothetical protein
MMNRNSTVYDGDEIVESTQIDVTWNEVRKARNKTLSDCDFRFMSDQSPSDEWIAYRVFLRDLPQNYPDSANDAADALNEYEIPE